MNAKNKKYFFIFAAVLGAAAIGYYFYSKDKEKTSSAVGGSGKCKGNTLPACPGANDAGCICRNGHWGTYYDSASGNYICKCFGEKICGSGTQG